MIIAGILGGIGSGKSTLSAMFVECGGVSIDADRLGHEVLRESEVMVEIRREFGSGVFGENGWIDRSRLARIVFEESPTGRARLAALEGMTHPRISIAIDRRIQELRSTGVSVVILDAPVLLKARWDRFCDHLIFVDCPQDQRRQRVLRRGWTEEEWLRREASQESLEYKRSRCDIVIDNGGELSQTRAQVVSYYSAWSITSTSQVDPDLSE